MTVYEHMSWCQGAHNVYGACQIERGIDDHLTVALVGVPCDHARIELDGFVFDVAQLATLTGQLDELRPLLEVGDREASCEAHDHTNDEDEGDDDDVADPCTRCGDTKVNLLHVEDGHWWCRPCCATAGITWSRGP